MKKTIIILSLTLASIATVSISCNNSKTEFKKSAADTTRTPAIYLDQRGMLVGDFVVRISKDTSYFDTLNSETAKLTWKRDTVYYIPTLVPLKDSLGKGVVDSVGNPMTTLRYFPTTSDRILQDYNKKF